jgi:hypothetical protein
VETILEEVHTAYQGMLGLEDHLEDHHEENLCLVVDSNMGMGAALEIEVVDRDLAENWEEVEIPEDRDELQDLVHQAHLALLAEPEALDHFVKLVQQDENRSINSTIVSNCSKQRWPRGDSNRLVRRKATEISTWFCALGVL